MSPESQKKAAKDDRSHDDEQTAAASAAAAATEAISLPSPPITQDFNQAPPPIGQNSPGGLGTGTARIKVVSIIAAMISQYLTGCS